MLSEKSSLISVIGLIHFKRYLPVIMFFIRLRDYIDNHVSKIRNLISEYCNLRTLPFLLKALLDVTI